MAGTEQGETYTEREHMQCNWEETLKLDKAAYVLNISTLVNQPFCGGTLARAALTPLPRLETRSSVNAEACAHGSRKCPFETTIRRQNAPHFLFCFLCRLLL
jgi:hypothetical protein